MAEQKRQTQTARRGSEETELRRYEARLSLWKVILGTGLVGVAGVFIPGAVDFWKSTFEDDRKRIELRLAKQSAHQEYVKEFVETALNQDIELRIRFAEYFSSVSDDDYIEQWRNYLKVLADKKTKIRNEINILERKVQISELKKDSTDEELIQEEEDRRKLEWGYKELGYVQRGKSIVPSQSEKTDLASTDSKDTAEIPTAAAPWLQFAEAEHSGPWKNGTVKEDDIEGTRKVILYFRATDFKTNKVLPWAGAFVAWCIGQSGYSVVQGSARGANWRKWGRSLPLSSRDIPPGAVVVLDLPGSSPSRSGHVGFYSTKQSGAPGRITLLGGNQSNTVKHSDFPRSRVVAIRWVEPSNLSQKFSKGWIMSRYTDTVKTAVASGSKKLPEIRRLKQIVRMRSDPSFLSNKAGFLHGGSCVEVFSKQVERSGNSTSNEWIEVVPSECP